MANRNNLYKAGGLIATVLLLLTAIFTTWGDQKQAVALTNQAVETNTEEIKELDTKKVEKEIFQMHLDAEKDKFDAVQTSIQAVQRSMDDGIKRIDKRLERIEAK